MNTEHPSNVRREGPAPGDDMSERAAARLLSLAAHELNTPVSVVRGYLRMLQRDADPPLGSRDRRIVDAAEQSCERIVELVGQLADIAKLDGQGDTGEDSRAAGMLASFDLFAVVEDAARDAREAADRHVRLVARGPAEGAPIRGDRARVAAAFAALLRGVLREQRDEALVVVDRRLTGEGPHAEALVVIAQESRVDHAARSSRAPFDETRGGLGLSLPIARRVVERHGGRVWSPAADDGTASARGAVVVSFPCQPSAARP